MAEIGGEPVSGFYLRPGLERLIGRVEASEEYPAPAVSSREGCEPASLGSDWPAPVLALEREARGCGWGTRRAYARGRFPHGSTGKPLAERETFSVRFGRDRWQGYAIYAAGAWASIMVTGKDLPPFAALNRTELSAWLASPRAAGDEFYDVVRERVRLAAERAKQRAQCNLGSHPAGALSVPFTGQVRCAVCDNVWASGATPWRRPGTKGRGEAS